MRRRRTCQCFEKFFFCSVCTIWFHLNPNENLFFDQKWFFHPWKAAKHRACTQRVLYKSLNRSPCFSCAIWRFLMLKIFCFYKIYRILRYTNRIKLKINIICIITWIKNELISIFKLKISFFGSLKRAKKEAHMKKLQVVIFHMRVLSLISLIEYAGDPFWRAL